MVGIMLEVGVNTIDSDNKTTELISLLGCVVGRVGLELMSSYQSVWIGSQCLFPLLCLRLRAQ